MIFILLSLPKLTECQLQERGIYLGPSFRVNIWLSHSILSLRWDTGPQGDDGTVTFLIFLFAPAINNFRQKSRLKAKQCWPSLSLLAHSHAQEMYYLLMRKLTDKICFQSSQKRKDVNWTKDLIVCFIKLSKCISSANYLTLKSYTESYTTCHCGDGA